MTMTTHTATPSALQGVRVLDLTTVVFGPYASQILADYGADVIKIESPEGDSTRRTGPQQERDLAAIFLGINRNKRSIVLNLKQPDARDALYRLIDSADVIMHSMRPEKMERLGLGPQALCAQHPRLIYAGLYGFGEGGAYAGRPAYDDIVQGLSGIADITQRQGGEPRYLPTIAADKTCGLVAAHAILAALFQRERTGLGQQLEVPMFESMASYLLVEHFYGRHLQDTPGTAGYPRVLAPWRRPYQTRDGHLCMMPYTDAHWQRFFNETGHTDLATDTRFTDITERTKHIEDLYALVGQIVATHHTAYWLELCQRLEIPAAPVNRLDDLEQDPHLQSVDFFVPVTSAAGHQYRFTRNPVRLQRSHVAPAMPPRLGEHTREVLQQAGFSANDIGQLLASGSAFDANAASPLSTDKEIDS